MREWKRYLVTAIAITCFGLCLWGGATFTRVKTWSTGDILTSTDLNAEFDNFINNLTPAGIDDQSTNAAAMQATADPYPSSTASLATSLQGELERLRYVIKQITGQTYWYVDPSTTIAALEIYPPSYKKPKLVYMSATQVDVATNTGTANTTEILFPDGNLRTVTENTASTHKYRGFVMTSTASFAAGSTEDSGLYTGVTESTNTFYFMYAVKSSSITTNYVLVGTTLSFVQENYATLNSDFGTDGWVYLGAFVNGDNGGSQGDILPFVQNGDTIELKNVLSTDYTYLAGPGISYGHGTGNLSWAFSAGSIAGTNAPSTFSMLKWQAQVTEDAAAICMLRNYGGTINYTAIPVVANNWANATDWIPSVDGVSISPGANMTETSISLCGWKDDGLDR